MSQINNECHVSELIRVNHLAVGCDRMVEGKVERRNEARADDNARARLEPTQTEARYAP